MEVMSNGNALMAAEALEAPDVVRRQTDQLARPLGMLAARLRRAPPQVVITCARGSSAHAASLGKGLIERYLGIPVADASPSVVTVYHGHLRLRDQLFITISQSGRSEDLVESACSARTCGALTVAIVNDVHSPLASACEVVIPMMAGPEVSVAATKTFVASAAVLLRLVGEWACRREMLAALELLPERLREASALDWSELVNAVSVANTVAILGRGPTLPIAKEASLKLKEICYIHADGYSSAEFQHGPIALVAADYPVLALMPTDNACHDMEMLVSQLRYRSTSVFVTGHGVEHPRHLPVLPPEHPETDALCLIQTFYGLAAYWADQLGLDASRPRNLQKITQTR